MLNCTDSVRNTLYEVCDPLFREIDKLIKEQVSSVRLKRLEKGVSNGYAVKVVVIKAFVKLRTDRYLGRVSCRWLRIK